MSVSSLPPDAPCAAPLHPSSLSTSDLRRLLHPITLASSSPRAAFANWAGTYKCNPRRTFAPTSSDQLPYIFELARRLGTTVRAAGAGHSPSDLACTNGFMVRTDALDRVLEVNIDDEYVVVEGGTSLNKLHQVLAANGLAMSNVGSISDQSIAGIVTTATHGTGVHFGVIPTHVLALDVMLPSGQVVHCSQNDNYDLFQASRCGLGATGFIISVTLKVERAFRLRERRAVIPFDHAVADLDELAHSAEHAKLWWFPSTGSVRFFAADRTYDPPSPKSPSWFWDIFVGFHIVQLALFLGRYFSSIVPLVGKLVLWLGGESEVVVDDSYRIFNLDCLFSQYTTEWAIPYENTRACLSELREWLDQEHADPCGQRPHFPIEVRFSDADDIWLSPSNSRKSCWIGIVQFKPYGLPVAYRKLFERFEQIVASHGGRPHWAKAHGLVPDDFRRLYPKFDQFVKVLRENDPQGMFVNPYVRRHVLGETGSDVGGRVFKERP
ncbi:D-arabinono-1,4-lactone oxidase [Tulasnella sp. 403]|nr:D-arabinono-1,4-lactone oxidase [Tulasnella sp. 403]